MQARDAPITRELADYVANSRFEDIPAEVRREAIRSLINVIGCCVAGSRHETVEAALAALKESGEHWRGPSTAQSRVSRATRGWHW